MFSQLLQVVATAVVARHAGTASYGVLAVGLAISNYMLFASSIGFIWHGIQGIARDTEATSYLVSNITAVRFLMSLAILIGALFVPVGVPEEYRAVIVVFAAAVVVDTLSPEWVFVARQRQELLAAVSVTRRLAATLVVLAAVLAANADPVLAVPIGNLVANVLGTGLALVLARRYAPGSLRPNFQPRTWLHLAMSSLGLHGGVISARLDVRPYSAATTTNSPVRRTRPRTKKV